MKKYFAWLVLALMLCSTASVSLSEVIVLSSPDMNADQVTGSIDDMKLGKDIDLGDRVYTPQKYETRNVLDSRWDGKTERIESGKDSDLLVLWIDVLNYSQKEQTYFKDATVVVTFQSGRGAYQFGGSIRQLDASCSTEPYNKQYVWAIQPLYVGYYLVYCPVPNYVIDNSGELKMEITTDETTLTYYIRK